MTEDELIYFRDRLATIKRELEESLAQIDPAKESITPDSAIGRLTRMEAIQAQSMTDEGRRRQEARLRQVEVALERIERGLYGRCTTCGSEIPKGRLEIMPESRLCMTCAARVR